MPIAPVHDLEDDMLLDLGGRETASHVVIKWYDQTQAASAKKEQPRMRRIARQVEKFVASPTAAFRWSK